MHTDCKIYRPIGLSYMNRNKHIDVDSDAGIHAHGDSLQEWVVGEKISVLSDRDRC